MVIEHLFKWGAHDAGFEAFLVPYESLQEPKQLGDMQVIPVKNIREAWAIAAYSQGYEIDRSVLDFH